jgi:hypothetical protein
VGILNKKGEVGKDGVHLVDCVGVHGSVCLDCLLRTFWKHSVRKQSHNSCRCHNNKKERKQIVKLLPK